MRAHHRATLVMALAVVMPAAAQEREPTYSLEQLKEIARSAHPTLEAAEAAAAAAAGILRQSKAYPNPGLSVGFGRGRPRDGGDGRAENQIQLVQPIEMPGFRKWRRRLAEVRLRGAEIDRVLAGTVVDSTTALLTYTVLLEERRTEIARESAEIAEHLHQLLARRAEIGESSPLELSRARSEWYARRRDLLDAEAASRAALAALAQFCGDRLPDAFGIGETLQSGESPDLPGDLPERLRDHNPLLLRAGIEVEASEVSMEIARKEMLPGIELFGEHVTELDREAWSAGIGLTIPIWNRNRGSIIATTAQQSAASSELRALALELETSLERASADYRRALGAIRLHEEGWTSAARRSLDIVTFSFENGEASLLEVLDAQRSYLAVGLDEAESRARLALARAEIERLIAGPLASEDTDEHP